jgi:hypothetical protein
MSLYKSSWIYTSLTCLINEPKFLFTFDLFNKQTELNSILYESSSSCLWIARFIYNSKYSVPLILYFSFMKRIHMYSPYSYTFFIFAIPFDWASDVNGICDPILRSESNTCTAVQQQLWP